MAKNSDNFELDEEGEDAYAAVMAGSATGKRKATDDGEDELEDEPSVEAEIAAQEGGLVDDDSTKRKKKDVIVDELDEEEKAADELRLIDELAETIEEERDELMNEEEEGL